MPTTQMLASQPLTESHSVVQRRPAEDVVYKLVTLAAILLVLGSLWLF